MVALSPLQPLALLGSRSELPTEAGVAVVALSGSRPGPTQPGQCFLHGETVLSDLALSTVLKE